jgi:hypothetical protein
MAAFVGKMTVDTWNAWMAQLLQQLGFGVKTCNRLGPLFRIGETVKHFFDRIYPTVLIDPFIHRTLTTALDDPRNDVTPIIARLIIIQHDVMTAMLTKLRSP